MGIGTGDDIGCYLTVSVNGGLHTVLEKYLLKESKSFQEKAIQLMTGCDSCRTIGCSTYGSDSYVSILGKEHQTCGGRGLIGFAWHEPSEDDIPMIRRLLEIECGILDEEQTTKKK